MSIKVASIVVSSVISLIIIYGVLGLPDFGTVTPLAEFYLYNSYNVFNKTWWAGIPQVVNALVWDYRGFDTLFETAVFFIAAVGTLAILKEVGVSRSGGGPGLTLIAKEYSKIYYVLIITVALTTLIHGHKSPGGGFQAGSIVAVSYVILVAIFSRAITHSLGLTLRRLIRLQALGLAIITSIAFTGFLTYLLTSTTMYILQNQPKPWSPGGFPENWLFSTLSGGSIPLLGLGEVFNVAAGYVIILLSLLDFGEGGD